MQQSAFQCISMDHSASECIESLKHSGQCTVRPHSESAWRIGGKWLSVSRGLHHQIIGLLQSSPPPPSSSSPSSPSSDLRSSTIISTTTINVIITISRFWIFYSHHIISENHHWQNLEKSQSNQNHWQNALILFINWFFPSSTTVYHPLVQPIFRGKTKCLLSQHITSVFSNHQHTSAHNST